MDLYITLNSPYARLARIMRIEKGLQSECKIKIATTRKLGSPFYNINIPLFAILYGHFNMAQLYEVRGPQRSIFAVMEPHMSRPP